MPHITIIGAGWLGQPLANTLVSLGHQVSASHTTSPKCLPESNPSIHSLVIDLKQTNAATLATQLAQCHSQIVIGCFPPGFRHGTKGEYVHHWQTLVTACQLAQVEKIVMVSSTTVYPSQPEEMYEECATLELAHHRPDFSEPARWMLMAEQAVIESGLSYAIVRLSGLIGAERHPARFVHRLQSLSTQAPANILHQWDAIGAVAFCALQVENHVVNATTPFTVSKAEFYQHAAQLAGLTQALPPIVHTPDKRIMADKLQRLGYRFHFSHTLNALEQLDPPLESL